MLLQRSGYNRKRIIKGVEGCINGFLGCEEDNVIGIEEGKYSISGKRITYFTHIYIK